MIDLSTKNNRHRLVMFTNLAIIWGAHLAWRCEKKHCLMISCREGKKLVWILVCMNSKYYTWRLSNWRYPEIIQVMDDHDHDLVLKQPWSLGNSPWKFPSFRKPPYHINESFKAATHGHVPTHPIRARKNRSAKKPIQPKWSQICSACVLYMYVYYIYT